MQHINTIPSREIFPGLHFQLVHGSQSTLSVVTLEKGSTLPEHQHPQEQITWVMEGQLDMRIGGEAFSLTPGMIHVIPPGILHSAVAVTEVKVVDFFSPARDDYR